MYNNLVIHSRDSYRYLSVGMVLYVFDRLRRYFMRLLVRYSIVEITADHDIIRLDMKQRGPVYMPLPKPGQYLFLRIHILLLFFV